MALLMKMICWHSLAMTRNKRRKAKIIKNEKAVVLFLNWNDKE